MKKASYLIVLLLGLVISGFAQTNHATNVDVHAEDNKLRFTFDLLPNGEHHAFQVFLKSINSTIKPKTVQGTGKTIMAGKGLTITWYYGADEYSKEQLEGIEFEVWALDPLEDNSPPVYPAPAPPPSYGTKNFASLSLGAAGLGLVGTGLSMQLIALQDYEIYSENRVESASPYPYKGMNRQELYTNVKDRYKRSQAMMIGGGVILGAAFLIHQISKRKRLRHGKFSYHRMQVQPVWGQGLASSNLGSSSSLGLHVGWRF